MSIQKKNIKKNYDVLATIEHGKTIRKNKFLEEVYKSLYSEFKQYLKNLPKGKIVELGSGAGFLKETIPQVITSDPLEIPGVDMCFYAEKLPFKDKTVAAYFGLNVLHHVKDPGKALLEIDRTLKKGGRVVFIEPNYSWWPRIFYKYIHKETYNEYAGWKSSKKSELFDSNIALPWIIFVRDKKQFEKKFPDLKIKKIRPHTAFSYFLSGGLTGFQFLPKAAYPIVKSIEKQFSKIGLFVTIELVKQ